MSLENRYDALVKDMLSLMQEALMRFLTNRQVNISKFQQYFCNFYKKMCSLEQQFHIQKAKYTPNLMKLQQFFKLSDNAAKFSLQPNQVIHTSANEPMKLVQPSNIIKQPKIVPVYPEKSKKNKQKQRLNIIGEQDELWQLDQTNKRRSGTAQGKRVRNDLSCDSSSHRPKTGIYRSKDRYQNHTISYNNKSKNTNRKSHFSQFTDQSATLQPYQKQDRERKTFYDDLEKQAQAEIVYQNKIKIPKKNSISTHRWSFKINKLF